MAIEVLAVGIDFSFAPVLDLNDNPMDRGAWWAAVYGVAQSRTRPK